MMNSLLRTLIARTSIAKNESEIRIQHDAVTRRTRVGQRRH
jgi:hypothetical protein